MLMGAEILLYPTAIGTEPHDPDLDTSRLWRRAMIGHAVSNVVPVVAANRIGDEGGQIFYGHSLHLRRARRHPRRVRRDRDRRDHRHARPRRRQAPPRRLRLLPRPPARLYGRLTKTSAPLIRRTRRSSRFRLRRMTSHLQAPARTPPRTSPRSAGRYSGCSASNDSYRSGCGRRAGDARRDGRT